MNVVDGLKQAAATLRAADKIPEYNAILDAQQKIFDLQNENQELKVENNELKRHSDLQFEEGHQWLIDTTLGAQSPRFCPRCWDKDRARNPLSKPGNYCTQCKKPLH